jgi:hypothetical protein
VRREAARTSELREPWILTLMFAPSSRGFARRDPTTIAGSIQPQRRRFHNLRFRMR